MESEPKSSSTFRERVRPEGEFEFMNTCAHMCVDNVNVSIRTADIHDRYFEDRVQHCCNVQLIARDSEATC